MLGNIVLVHGQTCKDILTCVECTMKLCLDFKSSLVSNFMGSLCWSYKCTVRGIQWTWLQLMSHQIVLSRRWMSLSSSTLFCPSGLAEVQLLAESTLRTDRPLPQDCGNTEAFTHKLLHSSKLLCLLCVCTSFSSKRALLIERKFWMMFCFWSGNHDYICYINFWFYLTFFIYNWMIVIKHVDLFILTTVVVGLDIFSK